MSKVKKLLAIVLSMVMILGMTVTTFAENKKPENTDTANITVSGIERGATVVAYKIVKADYNSAGLTGYSKVDDTDDFDIYDPDSLDITVLAQKYRQKYTSNPESALSLTQSEVEGNVVYTLNNQTAGTYLILVVANNTAKIYNPMVVSLAYKTKDQDSTASGSSNELQPGNVTAESNWSFGDTDAYAKSSMIDITKEVNKNTEDLGTTVTYTVKTTVPDYSDEYETVTYEITDTLTGLTLDPKSINISVSNGHSITTDDYTLDTYDTEEDGKEGFLIQFNSKWIKQNGEAEITVTYNATVSGTAVNEEAHYNNVTLNYTNKPGDNSGTDSAKENVYTFDIDGTLTADILKKVEAGKTEGTTVPLKDAEFTLYTDQNCTTQYTNTTHTSGKATATSDAQGQLHITGLEAGTYYLKETKAPAGYTLNDTIYKIVIDAIIEQNADPELGHELKSWTITVTPIVNGEEQEKAATTNTFTVNGGEASLSGDEIATAEIMNTTLSSLPSTGGIGTTIFTIGGCVIMIAAAGLYFASRRKENK